MATKFLEPGGDVNFNGMLWVGGGGGGAGSEFDSVTVHGGHKRSSKYLSGTIFTSYDDSIAQAGSRLSFWLYIIALPAGTVPLAHFEDEADPNVDFRLQITTGGVLQFWDVLAQKGSSGATLATGGWYRISVAYTIASNTVNEFRVFGFASDGVTSLGSDISITNANVFNALTTRNLQIGNSDGTFDARFSDVYVDNSTSLTDPGNIWVTAKLPNANGTTNNFNVQIGAGGSGYGSGHSPQVNERPSDDTNGWSVVAAGATTEEYSIENAATGDIDISTATIVDFVGWVRAKSLLSETGSIIVAGATSNISLTSTITTFQAVAGSSTYPAGSTDIGMITTALATTVSLYECGIVVAYIPAVVSSTVRYGSGLLLGVY